jgi:hypothetical protein
MPAGGWALYGVAETPLTFAAVGHILFDTQEQILCDANEKHRGLTKPRVSRRA